MLEGAVSARRSWEGPSQEQNWCPHPPKSMYDWTSVILDQTTILGYICLDFKLLIELSFSSNLFWSDRPWSEMLFVGSKFSQMFLVQLQSRKS
jgi:hypothetical protein